MLDEATQIVDFFNKWTNKNVLKEILKGSLLIILDESLVKPITERFMI